MSPVPFSSKLALNHWVLRQFGCERFEHLAKELRNDDLVGIESDGTHLLHSQLRLSVPAAKRPALPDDRLLEIDHGIVGDTGRLNEARLLRGERPIEWRYFQWLALVFTEIYLDRFLRAPEQLLDELNDEIAKLNVRRPADDPIEQLDARKDAAGQLNQLSFWMATGSGKTLLMHAHLLQFRRLLATHRRRDAINRTILLTPNEGLSRQHRLEFRASGIHSDLFGKDRKLLHRGQVEILETTKLAEEMKNRQVDVAAFEGNNLVFVDEGHRGLSAGKQGAWMRRRAALTSEGFSFEYSATFGQAVKQNAALTNQYARSTIIDYSYRRFHSDGYGKDYRIFNLEGATADDWQDRYLLAALLTFFRQQWLHRDNGAQLVPFNLEHPLWVFVGSSVTKHKASTGDVSDVVRILTFLDRTLRKRDQTIEHIAELLARGLEASDGSNLFPGGFAGLGRPGETQCPPARDVFERLLRHTFNAPGGGAIELERLKNVPGEVALRVGENDPFGVVNVGDPGTLLKRCEAARLNIRDSEFAGSLFDAVNRPDSTVHVVIGARKFTEGWNSWRVSSMGLMNVGKSEGSQIIQMFGRGVRLKGRDMSLKRSSALPAEGGPAPSCLPLLETLQVFGVKATYMARFRDFLEAEGVSAERTTHHLPISRRPLPSDPPLKTIRLPKEVAGDEPHTAFIRLGPRFCLRPPSEVPWQVRRVVHDCYPKVRALRAETSIELTGSSSRNEAFFTPCHAGLLDLDSLFTDLVRFKAARGWHNFTVSRQAVESLLADPTWYRLQIPGSEMRLDDWNKVAVWQEAAAALLRKYATHLFGLHRKAWENKRLEYGPLADDDPNLLVMGGSAEPGYRVDVESSEKDLRCAIRTLQDRMAKGHFEPICTEALRAVRIDEHLYWPLLWANPDAGVQVAPPGLNDGEFRFVGDLRDFAMANRGALRHVDLHLIRNQSRGRGIGFFEAGNFHPDFILWAVEGRRQRIAFIDPKGLVHIGPDHEKVRLHKTIKETQKNLRDPDVHLDSFIVSVTRYAGLGDAWKGLSKAKLAEHHVLFQEDPGYIREILQRMGILDR